MTARMRCLQAAKSPQGGRPMDLKPMPESTARGAFGRLVKAGLLFRAGSRTDTRYFDTQEKARAFHATATVALVAIHRRRIPMGAKKPTTRAWWGPDDPAHETSATIYTTAPTPPAPTHTNTYPVW